MTNKKKYHLKTKIKMMDTKKILKYYTWYSRKIYTIKLKN